MRYREPLEEDLLDELTRLVGRPQPVLQEAVRRLVHVLLEQFEPELVRSLAGFPMTAWQSLAPEQPAAREMWSAALGAGLTAEEVFTTLAVIDDHVRRTHGALAWEALHRWAPRLLVRCGAGCHPAPERAATDGLAF
jgi:hypothetical protein